MHEPATEGAFSRGEPATSDLHDAGRYIRDITRATSALDAIQATLEAINATCEIASATLEVDDPATGDARSIASIERSVDESIRLVRISYPLDMDHPTWRTARMAIHQEVQLIGARQNSALAGALLTMLTTKLQQFPELPDDALNPVGHMVRSLTARLWQLESVGDLRLEFVHWLARELHADWAVIHTHAQHDSFETHPGNGSAYVPDAHTVPFATDADPTGWHLADDHQSERVIVVSHAEPHGSAFQVIAGRDQTSIPWSQHELDAVHAIIPILADQIQRVTSDHLSSVQSRYLTEMQELTAAAAAAGSIDGLCHLIHEAVTRFLPADTLQISLNIESQPDVVVFDRQSESIGSSASLTAIESPMTAENTHIGLIRVGTLAPEGFDAEHSSVLESIAQCTVGAFERQLLLEQVARQTRFETGLRLVAERISATIDADELLEIANDVLFTTMSIDIVSVSVIDRRTSRVTARSVKARGESIHVPPLGNKMVPGTVSHAAIHENRQVTASSGVHSGYSTFTMPPWSEMTHMVATPISISQELVGIVLAGRADTTHFSDHEMSLQHQIAGMLSTALENAYAYDERLRHARDLGELQRLGSRIASQLDLRESLDEIVRSATNVVNADGGAVAMADGDDLVVVGATGTVDGKLPERLAARGTFLEAIMDRVAPLVVDDILTAEADLEIRIPELSFARSMLAVPIIDASGISAGIISVFSTQPRAWTERDVSLLTTLSSTSAIALQNASHFESTRDVLRASVESLATAVGAKDPGTRNHSRNVARFSRLIAQEMALSADVVGEIELAGLLHDVGKIGIPDSVLEKPGPLDAAEWAAVHLHPAIGEQILSGNPALGELLPMVRHHHERWDGHGYPDQLREQEIPAGSAIIAVAEALDAMTTHRPYQPEISWDDAVAELQSCAGSQFAPEVVDAFTRAYRQGAFNEYRARTSTLPSVPPDGQQARSPSLDVRALRIFESVASEIREGADLNTFLTRIAVALQDIIDVPYIAIFVREDEHAPLELITSSPENPARESLASKVKGGKGIVGWVARHGVIQNVGDVSKDSRYIVGGYEKPIRSELCVPLFAEGHVIGVINLESNKLNAFSEADEQLMISASDHIANAINVVQLHERLKRLSTTDALTGLYNHRTFFEKLEDLTSSAAENGSRLSVAILDVNELKAINDSYGHLAGDAALRAVANVLIGARRPGDVICRYGGDEFALILPGASRHETWEYLESLSVELMDSEFEIDGMRMPLPSWAWGTATLPDDSTRAMELLSLADQRMYLQKTGGSD